MSSGGAASPAEFVAIPKHGQVAPQSVTQKLTRVAFDLRWRLAIGGAILGLLLLGRWIFLAVRPASLVAPFTAAEAQAAQQVWAVALGKASPIERNSIGMELVLIPPGKFLMGDVSPVEVTLTQPYYLGKTEVTQGEWQTVMNTMPWQTHPDTNDDANSPATCVSWVDAQEFCKRLGEKERMTYRLPTEAEWEYACRAGTTTRFSFGDDALKLSDYGWWEGNLTEGGWLICAHRAGLKKANAWRLCDMHGNVWECCSDRYDDILSGGRNPAGPASEMYLHRVIRGGSWSSSNYDRERSGFYSKRPGHSGARSRNRDVWACSSASRSDSPFSGSSAHEGFRVVAVVSR